MHIDCLIPNLIRTHIKLIIMSMYSYVNVYVIHMQMSYFIYRLAVHIQIHLV